MKYIELFKNGFVSTITEKIKPENYPYVGYSPTEGLAFTIVPEPVTGPADNEIWYTTSDKTTVGPESAVSAMPGNVAFGVNIISNTYDGDKGIIVCDNPILTINGGVFIGLNNLTSLVLSNSITELRPGSIQDCVGLTEITLSKNLKITQSGVLSRTDLREVEFPDGFEQLGIGTLAYCNNLSKVILPASITSISTGVLSNWPKTTNIIYKGTKELLLSIVVEHEANQGVTIHCIDGDIVL